MLQIKKKMIIKFCHHNLTFLFREKSLDSKFLLKKRLNQSITLRAPKHFNIGKHKIYSLNTKALNLKYNIKRKIHVNYFLKKAHVWPSLSKLVLKNTYVLPKSITIGVLAKFRLT